MQAAPTAVNIVTIRKLDAASQSHGRGSDNKRVPARWGIYYNGALVGTIIGKAVQQYGVAEWTVYKIGSVTLGESYLPIKSMLKSRAAAVAWVQQNATEFTA